MINEKKSFTIKDWAASDRPREKLISKGIQSLTDAELVAVLIGSGNRKVSAVELAKIILSACDHNLRNLSQLSLEQLLVFDGVGEAKASAIITALELGRRCFSEQNLSSDKITSSKDVFGIMCSEIGSLQHEEFWVLYLNNSNKILQKQQISKGGLTGTVVDVRLVLKKALNLLATGIILCHNHPSGNLTPSTADKQITNKLKAAGETMDIKVLDHLIITEKMYFSFADENLL
ncbi:RadC family protein [Flavicella sediminum]|uniref:RadC family protein n=1 Tax=Flavicella sediminum TaxID=2585141 RepID=UPI00112438C2|nr:DNA repair protein RadC [Flavicella sediminum]